MTTTDTNPLFDLDQVKQDSPRLVLLKEHDIQTHFNKDCEPPWLAIPMNLARPIAKKWNQKGKFETIPEICASVGITLDERGLLFFADTKEDAEADALAYALNVKADS